MKIYTDHVYGGSVYHIEEDVKILNFYAYTKYLAEYHAAKCENHINIRTNFFGNLGGFGNQSYSDWIVASLRSGAPFKLQSDCLFNPVSLGFLSPFIANCLDKPLRGTFNVGSRSGMSKYQFGRELAQLLGLPGDRIMDTFTSPDPGSVARPLDMRMHTSKIESNSGKMPGLLELLYEVAHEHADSLK